MTSLVSFTDIRRSIITSSSPERRKTLRRVNYALETTSTKRPSTEKPKTIAKPVFLYLEIVNIANTPEFENDMVLRVEHGDSPITKMQDRYTTDHDINLTQLKANNEKIPILVMTVDQDNLDELNNFSNTPVIITLFERIPAYMRPVERTSNISLPALDKRRTPSVIKGILHTRGTSTELVEEQWIPKAKGYIDMLKLFSSQKQSNFIEVFIYPLKTNDMDFFATMKINWKIYSLMPLIPTIEYTNIVFFTLESLYNVNTMIFEDDAPNNFTVKFSFQSTIPNEKNEFDKAEICQFYQFNYQRIDFQRPFTRWASVQKTEKRKDNYLGNQIGCDVNIKRIFQNLLGTEGCEFNFHLINKREEYAMVYNAMNRYVLTKKFCQVLEDVIAFKEQHILLEVFRPENPDDIIYEGKIDLSVFLYPRVNAMRFAVELTPPDDKTSKKGRRTSKSDDKKMTAKGKTQKQQAMGDTGSIQQDRPTFAIVNICMLTPLTEKPEPIANNTNNVMRKDQLNYCAAVEDEAVRKTTEQILSESYFQYDEVIGLIIDYIVNNDITSTEDHKHSLCCQLGNLVNKIVKIIAYDFNKRVPTENNIQFMNLMTTVYKELVERQYNILQNCVDNDLSKCFIPDLERQDKIITMLTMSKYMDIAGNPEMAQLLHGKVVDDNPSNSGLNFYTFLYDVEKMNFDEARTYFQRPIREKDKDGEYFSLIAEIYIDYLEKLNDKETELEAYEFLLLRLQLFLNIYPLEMDCWILLYCLYRSSGYLPGISYTRWKYENLTDKPRHQLPRIPKSRWEIYCKYKLKPSSTKAKLFYTVFEIFMMTGLYQFAEFIYYEMMDELNEAEKFFTKTTLKILQDKVEPKYATKTFPVEKMPNGLVVGAFQAQNNGNLEFHKGNKEQAMMQYGKIVDSSLLTDYEDFHLSLFRYGYYMLENGQYEKAVRAFTKCTQGINDNGLATYMGLGKAKYWAGKLEDARYFFAQSTCYEIHIPDIWAYLALINLKLKDNFKALECWKYAKLDPKTAISDEILAELDAIDYNDVNLYVDIPDPTQMTQMTYTANQ